ncbi:MAG TPA: hypothetical protein PK566_08095 [Pseudobacteroides sp.]|nr:hypothetical protein [Pseudobacteroides sp.]
MKNRVILRTISNLSFAGTLSKDVSLENTQGVTLKMSDASQMRIWLPYDEIECVLLPNGQRISGENLAHSSL